MGTASSSFYTQKLTVPSGKVETAPAGYYIPIDYEYVRSTSNAMGPDWRLETLYAPEKMFGMWLL